MLLIWLSPHLDTRSLNVVGLATRRVRYIERNLMTINSLAPIQLTDAQLAATGPASCARRSCVSDIRPGERRLSDPFSPPGGQPRGALESRATDGYTRRRIPPRRPPGLAGIFCPEGGTVADRVMVFVDYQNVYGWARRQFHGINPASADGHVDPLRLGRHLVSCCQRPSELNRYGSTAAAPTPTNKPTQRRPMIGKRRGGTQRQVDRHPPPPALSR